jgi:hypothetical protein
MFFGPRVALTLLAALFALALPTAASAAVYEVDSTGDEADAAVGTAGCLTVGLKCTLRAALEESNSSTGVEDTILFKASEFQGQLVDTISPATPLPTITAPVEINAGTCATAAGVNGPCAGVDGPSGESVLSVEGDGTSIFDLAVTGGAFGVHVINATTGFILRGSWIGVKLDGSNGGSTRGVYIDPDSNGATIGGAEAVQRNVISNNVVGLDIEGADDALIEGNWFGVDPDGTTSGVVSQDIEITNYGGFTATGNQVGATIEGAALASADCDGGCNVISGAFTGIDLNGTEIQGETPADGPTTIHGNFVGLDPTGTEVVPNGMYGIFVGAADEAMVGGPEYEKNANFIAGGSIGIYDENGDDFQAVSNQIGIGPITADTTAPPSAVGIFVFGLSATEKSTIEANAVRMAGGVAIEQRFLGATIAENLISGAETGILSTGSGATGSLIADNMIGSVTGNGILIRSDGNEVFGNLILSSGAAGVKVQDSGPPFASPTTGNVLGGDVTEDENEISDSGGPAIQIVDFEETANEVGRNTGKLNDGAFIDLVATNPGTEPKGPNDGIAPPSIGALTETSASGGGAREAAVIRVFRKGSAEPGELESFLGETTADSEGNWKVDYPTSIPGGTIVAATQTSKGATSELAVKATPGGSDGGEGGGGGPGGGSNGGNSNGNNGASQDKTPPDTKIVKGPPKKTHKTTVKLKFTATEADSTFQCKMDRKPFKGCRSPKTYKKLKPGKHVFKVRAIDRAGNVDPTPAKRKFTVLR